MKKLVLIFAISFFGCKQTIQTTEEDGCEYFIVKTAGVVTAITHKGNCSNQIHQYIDTTDLIEQSPQFKVYVRRTDKNSGMDFSNMGTTPVTVYCSK
jgi:hypothetical protein